MKTFVSESDGCLYDTNRADWTINPVRENYCWHHRTIESGADLRACLRAGAFAWPGGYPLFFVTSDGGALSFDAVRTELFQVIYSIRHGIDDGWRVVACCIADGDEEVYCDHTGEPIN